MRRILKENLIKNLILIVLLIIMYFPIQDYFLNNNLDKSLAGDMLTATGIIAVIACFGNFAFSYESIKERNSFQRNLAHGTTGLLMLTIGISLIFTKFLIEIIMGSFILMDLTLILLYIASIGYDFWDLFRLK